jgi:hypothetical protein
MVNDQEQDTRREPANQALHDVTPEPNRVAPPFSWEEDDRLKSMLVDDPD